MTIFFWRKNRLIDNFSVRLADEVYSQLPPDQVAALVRDEGEGTKQRKKGKNAAKKVNLVIDTAVTQVKRFIEEQSLGVYGKARFHMQFMERLNELGYDQEAAKALNESIMLKIPGK